MKDRLFDIWFSLRVGIANREFRPVLERYESTYDLFEAEGSELAALPCSENLRRALADKSVEESYRILHFCEQNGVDLIFWQDEAYPEALRTLSDPPVLLYVKGKLPDMNRRLAVSVVGTRKMGEYGKRMAYKIGYELGAARAVVVSGMALGNDSVAAAGTIAAGGQTVAVLGCGIDLVYPAEHTRLCREIEKHGAVVTEYPPSTPPVGRNFPIRNRIISGLGQATLIIEADKRSGALITAKTALSQGRDLYAVPGNVGDVNTEGTNQLIRDGAVVALCARDLLENYTHLYGSELDMVRLLQAERNPTEPDDALERLEVCSRNRTAKGKERKTGDVPAPTPIPTRNAPPAMPPEPRQEAARATPPPPAAHPHVGDASERIVASLTETQRGIFTALPLDRAVPVDYIAREGFSMTDIMASMTILEIKGLVVSLPGGLYSRK